MYAYGEPRTNLEDLRSQLTGSLALASILVCAVLAYGALEQQVFQLQAFSLYVVVIVIGFCVRRLLVAHAMLASRLLIGYMTAVLLIAMWLLPEADIPYLGLLLIFISAMLITGGEWITSALVAVCAVWWTKAGWRNYPLSFLLVSLAVGVILARLTTRTLYTALQWAWNSQRRADDLLEQTREHRAEQSRTLKSLELSYSLQRRLQDELIAARNEANTARQMKERFAANISHELRTPLNLILGFSDVMYVTPEAYGDFTWPPKLRRDIYQIHRSSKHLLEMIDDILDLSRQDMIGFTLHRETTSLDSLLRNTAEIVADLFQDPAVRLEVVLAPDLPQLEVDRTRIRQVIINLISNARRFTEHGCVRLEAYQAEDEVVVCVSDTGPGIPADELERIFDEFYQVDLSIRRKQQGFGLGLAICKRFVQAHNGRIWVESQEGVGSRFYFTLPKSDQSTVWLYTQEANYLRPADSQRPNILVVDPDPTVAAWVGRHIENMDVLQVIQPEQLADQVLYHHPRAVIYNVRQDRSRPDMEIDLPVPVIECSLPSQSWVAEDLAVSAVLTKPVTPERLLLEVKKLAGIRDILIVDDSEEFVQLVRRVLESANLGFEIRQAYDGSQGLAAMRERRPDLVLLDLIMPEMDGFQFLSEMHQDERLRGAAVIIVTASDYQPALGAIQAGQLVVKQSGGLSMSETACCITALMDVLKPHYDEQSLPQEVAVE